jgi:hypothetical protein
MGRSKIPWRIAAWSALAVALLAAVWFSSRVVLGEHIIGKGFGIVASDAEATNNLSQIESPQFAERVLQGVKAQDTRLASFNAEQERLKIEAHVASNGQVWLSYSFAGNSLVEFDVAQWSFSHGATETAEIGERNEVIHAAILAELDRIGWRLKTS